MSLQNDPMYKMVLESTYISLAQGVEPQMLEYILENYEEDENYEACAAMSVALAQWKEYDGNCRVGDTY